MNILRVGASIGHADGEGSIVTQTAVKLVLKLPSPDALPSGAIALGISALDHKALDDTVKDSSVVVPIPRVSAEVLHSLWTLRGKELNRNVSVIGA